MSVVEKAGGVVHDSVERLRVAAAPEKKTAAPRDFDIDFDHLKSIGGFTPDAPSSQLSQELRAIKRRLMRRIGFLRESGERKAMRAGARQRNLIMVTSTRAGEGKTFSAMNLALSFALEDKIEALLVDADIQRPKVLSRLGLPAAPGVADRLKNPDLSIESLMLRANQGPLSVLSEGAYQEEITELYDTTESKRLWAELSANRPDRLVIIDAPPVLATTEAVVLAKYADEIIFVVEAGKTPEPAISSALDELLDINPSISLMLNRCLIGSGGSHYGSYEYYDRRSSETETPDRKAKLRGKSNGE